VYQIVNPSNSKGPKEGNRRVYCKNQPIMAGRMTEEGIPAAEGCQPAAKAKTAAEKD